MVLVLSAILISNAVFNVLVWPTFYRRVAKDPRARDAVGKRTAFLTVHVVLVAIALALAVASVIAAIFALTTT